MGRGPHLPEDNPMLNLFQKICAATYADADFAEIPDIESARTCGDTLFTFLMIELATSEGCDNREEAMRRLDRASANIEEVIDALARSPIHNADEMFD